jgi:hypothetical protein
MNTKKTFIIAIALALLLASLTVLAAGQSPEMRSKAGQSNLANSPNTADCTYNFSSGVNNTYFRFCVTTTGNIPEIETPQGRLQVSFDRHEGYGICNETPPQAYYDYGQYGDSGNWGAATVLIQTATSVKIARTTLDGIWTLTQTFTLVPATPSVKVVMALKNNTAAARVAYLVRHVDIDADWSNLGTDLNNFSATTDGAFGWNASIPFGANSGYGLQLQNSGEPQFGYLQGFARTTFQPPNPCNFAGDSSGTVLTDFDGSVALAYVDTIGAKKTKTATMIYRGF